MTADEQVDKAAPRGPRGSYAKGQARRQAIVDEALAVFSRTGSTAGRCARSPSGWVSRPPG